MRISTESFPKVIAAPGRGRPGPTAPASRGGPRFCSASTSRHLQLLTRDEERRLHLEMVEGVVAAGYAELVFKAQPSAPAGPTGPLVRPCRGARRPAAGPGVPELVETWYAAGAVDLAVSCFCTALATAGLFGVPTARVGTELLLERLNPYPNSNRMPATVVAATVPPLSQRAAQDVPAPLPDGTDRPAARHHGRLPHAAQPQRRTCGARPSRYSSSGSTTCSPTCVRAARLKLDLPDRLQPPGPRPNRCSAPG